MCITQQCELKCPDTPRACCTQAASVYMARRLACCFHKVRRFGQMLWSSAQPQNLTARFEAHGCCQHSRLQCVTSADAFLHICYTITCTATTPALLPPSTPPCRCEQIQKREVERRAADERAHQDEVRDLERTATQSAAHMLQQSMAS